MKVPIDMFKKETNMNTAIKNWEAAMHSALRAATIQNPYDAVNLYLKLEKASKKYLASGEMQEGDTFRVHLETGIILDISFYKEYSTVKANYPNGKSKMLIDEQDSYRKEYRELEATSLALETAKLGIGPRFSRNFFETMAKAKPGDVYVFDNDISLLCDGKLNNMLSFIQVTKNKIIPSIDEFGKQKRFSLNIDEELSIQNLYRKVKDNYTYDVKMSISSVTEARGILNKLLANKEITKELVIGPNKFVVQPSKEGKGLVYYDNKGNKISEEKILLLLSWLNVNPNKVEIKHLDPKTSVKEFTDIMFKRELDEHLAKQDFKGAVDFISGYCMKNPEVLQIDMSSYTRKDVDFEAVRFAFKYSEGEMQIKKITYEDNDFSKNPSSVRDASVEEVIEYCKQKYDDKFNYFKNITLDQIHKAFSQCSKEFFEDTVGKAIQEKMVGKSVFETKVSFADRNISSLMESSFEKNDNEKDESDSVEYDSD